MGHTGRGCPKSRQARKSTDNNNDRNSNTTRDDSNNNKRQPSSQANLKVQSDGKTRVVMTTKPSSKSEEDLRIKLNVKRATKPVPDQVEITTQKPLPPHKEIESKDTQGQQIEKIGGVTI